MQEDFDEITMDACLIAAGRQAEHYEMATYDALVAWALAMGRAELAHLLQQTRDEETGDAPQTTLALLTSVIRYIVCCRCEYRWQVCRTGIGNRDAGRPAEPADQ